MKPNELIKILDSGVVHELKIYYCGGLITIDSDSCPFELPDYEIIKLWNSENGRGISLLLADGIAAEKETRKNAGFDAAELIRRIRQSDYSPLKIDDNANGVLYKVFRIIEFYAAELDGGNK